MPRTISKAKRAKPFTLRKGCVLILRTCAADMSSHNGFMWPQKGKVSAPDWKPIAECGNGLHGFLWGEGNGELANWSEDAKWLLVEVKEKEVVKIDGAKVKFPSGNVVFCGDRLHATEFLRANGGEAKAIVGGTATAGDRGTATAGYGGTATAGYRGTATAGDGGTATAGYGGTATAGDGGTALIKYFCTKSNRYKIAIGYVGEDGILPNRTYLVSDGKLTLKQ